jgi:superfamily II DNA or RNA helicase
MDPGCCVTDIVIDKKNHFHIKIDCDPGIARELSEHFTIEVPGAKFHPKVKAKVWDGKLRLFNYQSKTIYGGLAGNIQEFARKSGYSCVNNYVPTGKEVTRDEIEKFMVDLDPHAYGEKITPTDYQVDAVYQCILNERVLLTSPTSSGKSLMIGSLCRWYTQKELKCLIIVPTVALVAQMYGDFDDYFKESGWKAEDNCYCIKSGVEKKTDHPIIISTWQSLYKMPKSFFDEIDVILCDESHTASGKSITEMMEKMPDAPYRFGFTGTLNGTKCHALVLTGLFGPVMKTISTKELIQRGQIADLRIKSIFLQYTDEEKKLVVQGKTVKGVKTPKMTYAQEMDFLVSHEKRNKFLANLIIKQEGNTLVLFNLKKHGKALFELINSKVADKRKVFYISGDVDAEVREEIRHIVETETDAIILASYGTTQAGVSIRRIHNLVLASPSKSRIRVLQSVGRGLRKGTDKDYCNLYDIADDLSWKSKKNHTLNHAVERIKMYAEENFDYKIMRITL